MYDRPPFRIWFERAIPSLYEPMLEGVATFRLYVWDFQAAGRLCSRESGPHGVQVLWFAHRVQSESLLRVSGMSRISMADIFIPNGLARRASSRALDPKPSRSRFRSISSDPKVL